MKLQSSVLLYFFCIVLFMSIWPWHVCCRLLTVRNSQTCKYLNYFPEITPSQLYQSGKKDECLPGGIVIELQRVSSVLNLSIRKERKTFPPLECECELECVHDFKNPLRSWIAIELKSVWMKKKGFSLIIIIKC